MKSLEMSTVVAAVVVVLALPSVSASKHGAAHQVLNRRHLHHRKLHASKSELGGAELNIVEKRSKKCKFPTNAGLVAVTPGEDNAGWAMSPNQPCKPGMYCPYACPPGQLMAQWDPTATSYTYPLSMNGGLYCDDDGEIHKPFPNKPYCYDGVGSVGCVNKASGSVAFCQTVLPGNEAMLIPTNVDSSATLAVPGTDYWAGTAAHFYINPPGVSTTDACVWGTSDKPVGNWSPYVGGANVDASGQTFVKLGWNPIYLEPATPFRDVMPTWGVRIECEGGGCNGLPCAIDPLQNKVNECVGSASSGAGGGAFCVVTVPKGSKANYVVFDNGGASKPKSADPSPTPTPTPTPSSTKATSTSTTSSTRVRPSSSSQSSSTESGSPSAFNVTYAPHIFAENVTAASTPVSVSASQTGNSSNSSETSAPAKKSDATSVPASALGFTLTLLTAILAISI